MAWTPDDEAKLLDAQGKLNQLMTRKQSSVSNQAEAARKLIAALREAPDDDMALAEHMAINAKGYIRILQAFVLPENG